MPQNNRTEALLDLSHTMAAPLFVVCRYPYEILPLLGEVLLSLPYFLCREGYRERGIGQYIHPTATVSPGAYLEGPVVIGPRSVGGEGARLAGGALLGEECRIGRDCRLCGGIRRRKILTFEPPVPSHPSGNGRNQPKDRAR